MPGVIMDNGDRNGSHTNHDRDQRLNGVNGGSFVSEKGLDKAKGREPQQNMTPTSPTGPNVLNGMADSQLPPAPERVAIPPEVQERMNELPPEILHMTQGYMPLSTLITRFAQKTHNDLSAKILELAQMPLPASAVNGNVSHAQTDDNSAENINKKYRLLEFAQNAHADWAKAYVLTSWSRNSEEVGKLIDLKWNLDQQALVYYQAIHHMAAVKLDLGGRSTEVPGAGVPNPDLKTALQVLSTGKAPWMPEVCQLCNQKRLY
jgi:mediator of RNA polymerase II transcription subunit 14